VLNDYSSALPDRGIPEGEDRTSLLAFDRLVDRVNKDTFFFFFFFFKSNLCPMESWTLWRTVRASLKSDWGYVRYVMRLSDGKLNAYPTKIPYHFLPQQTRPRSSWSSGSLVSGRRDRSSRSRTVTRILSSRIWLTSHPWISSPPPAPLSSPQVSYYTVIKVQEKWLTYTGSL
jgi:hypothetical protein